MSLDAVLENIPHVKWPEQDGKYKVVQFLIDGRPYMRFGEKKHTSIVANFAPEIRAEIRVDTSGVSPIYFFMDENIYKIVGMGWCQLRGEIADFYGTSTDYQMGIDERYLETIKQISPDRAIFYDPDRIR